MLKRPNGFEGGPNTPSPIEFDKLGIHNFDVPQSCRFIVGAYTNKKLYNEDPNAFVVEVDEKYLNLFKTDEDRQKMIDELPDNFQEISGITDVYADQDELYEVRFEPGTDIATLIAQIDNRLTALTS